MIDKKAEGCIGAEVQEAELAVSSQNDARGFARVAGPGACVVETSNAKKSWIDLGGEAYKGKATAFKLGCNIYREWLGWSSSCVKPPASLQGYI